MLSSANLIPLIESNYQYIEPTRTEEDTMQTRSALWLRLRLWTMPPSPNPFITHSDIHQPIPPSHQLPPALALRDLHSTHRTRIAPRQPSEQTRLPKNMPTRNYDRILCGGFIGTRSVSSALKHALTPSGIVHIGGQTRSQPHTHSFILDGL